MGLISNVISPGLISNGSSGNLSLMLGSVQFASLELPETIGPLGGHEKLEAHDFPGGTRTIQTFGAFPEMISWKGILTGNQAFTRSLQIDRLRVAGTQITLLYGIYAYLGVIASARFHPKHQWFIPYEIEFLPQQDLSGSILALLAFAGLGPEIALAQQLGVLNSLNSATGGYLTLPSSMQGPVQSLLTQTGTSLTAAGGSVSAISPTNAGLIQSAIGSVISSAGPHVSALPASAAAAGGS